MRGTELLPPGRGSIVAISAPGVRMHGQERWSMLLLCLGLLAPALLPAAQKQEQDKTTLPARTPSRAVSYTHLDVYKRQKLALEIR